MGGCYHQKSVGKTKGKVVSVSYTLNERKDGEENLQKI